MVDSSDSESVLQQIAGFEWSSEESVAYEVAIEAANGLVGAYSALIAAEERKPVPDRSVIAAARAGQAECHRKREQLDPANPQQIAEARRYFTERAQAVRQPAPGREPSACS